MASTFAEHHFVFQSASVSTARYCLVKQISSVIRAVFVGSSHTFFAAVASDSHSMQAEPSVIDNCAAAVLSFDGTFWFS